MKKLLLFICIILISSTNYGQDIKTEKIMEIGIPLNPPVVVGSRAIYSWKEGQVTGMIHGKLLPLGAEFGKLIDNNTYQIDVRAVIETDDKESIYVTYSGYIFTDTETFNLINTGHGAEVDPSKYYFRSNPIFETKSTKYSWLNHTISVGVGTCTKTGVAYQIYAVK